MCALYLFDTVLRVDVGLVNRTGILEFVEFDWNGSNGKVLN